MSGELKKETEAEERDKKDKKKHMKRNKKRKHDEMTQEDAKDEKKEDTLSKKERKRLKKEKKRKERELAAAAPAEEQEVKEVPEAPEETSAPEVSEESSPSNDTENQLGGPVMNEMASLRRELSELVRESSRRTPTTFVQPSGSTGRSKFMQSLKEARNHSVELSEPVHVADNPLHKKQLSKKAVEELESQGFEIIKGQFTKSETLALTRAVEEYFSSRGLDLNEEVPKYMRQSKLVPKDLKPSILISKEEKENFFVEIMKYFPKRTRPSVTYHLNRLFDPSNDGKAWTKKDKTELKRLAEQMSGDKKWVEIGAKLGRYHQSCRKVYMNMKETGFGDLNEGKQSAAGTLKRIRKQYTAEETKSLIEIICELCNVVIPERFGKSFLEKLMKLNKEHDISCLALATKFNNRNPNKIRQSGLLKIRWDTTMMSAFRVIIHMFEGSDETTTITLDDLVELSQSLIYSKNNIFTKELDLKFLRL